MKPIPKACCYCPRCCFTRQEKIALTIQLSPLQNGLFDAKCPVCDWESFNSFVPNQECISECQ